METGYLRSHIEVSITRPCQDEMVLDSSTWIGMQLLR